MIVCETINGKSYKVADGTYYNPDTPDEIVELLEYLRRTKTRVRFYWGDPETGKDWGGEYGVTGTVSRSTGSIKIPILVHNKRSLGGTSILDNRIVRVAISSGCKANLYIHPTYHI